MLFSPLPGADPAFVSWHKPLNQAEAEACTAAMAGKDLLITPILGVDSAESISAMLGCDDKIRLVTVIG